jgi:hypothetical protein
MWGGQVVRVGAGDRSVRHSHARVIRKFQEGSQRTMTATRIFEGARDASRFTHHAWNCHCGSSTSCQDRRTTLYVKEGTLDTCSKGHLKIWSPIRRWCKASKSPADACMCLDSLVDTPSDGWMVWRMYVCTCTRESRLGV